MEICVPATTVAALVLADAGPPITIARLTLGWAAEDRSPFKGLGLEFDPEVDVRFASKRRQNVSQVKGSSSVPGRVPLACAILAAAFAEAVANVSAMCRRRPGRASRLRR